MANILSGDNIGKIYLHTGFSSTISNSFSSPSTGTVCVGWDGTNVLSSDDASDKVYLHTGFSSTISNSFSSPSTSPSGVAWDGTNVLSVDASIDNIYLHTGFSSTVSNSFSSPSSSPYGLGWDGTNVISSDSTTNFIYLHTGFSSTISNSFAGPASNVRNVGCDGTNLLSVDTGTDKIYLYTGFSSTISNSFSSPSTNPRGVAWDGWDGKLTTTTTTAAPTTTTTTTATPTTTTTTTETPTTTTTTTATPTTTTTTTATPTTTTTTTISIPPSTNIKINIGDVWKDVNSIKINIGDVWKDVIGGWGNISDVWKSFSVPEFSMTWDDIANVPVASASSVSDWNTFFQLPTFGTEFTSVIVNGNKVTFIGGGGLSIYYSLFLNDSSLISCIDTKGIITSVLDNGFKSSGLLTLKLYGCTSISDSGCRSIPATVIEIPNLVSAAIRSFSGNTSITKYILTHLTTIGDYCFEYNSSCSEIDIRACTALGSTTADNSVFTNINFGGAITITIPVALMTCNGGNPDGDIQYLIDNNTETIITI